MVTLDCVEEGLNHSILPHSSAAINAQCWCKWNMSGFVRSQGCSEHANWKIAVTLALLIAEAALPFALRVPLDFRAVSVMTNAYATWVVGHPITRRSQANHRTVRTRCAMPVSCFV
eukprot:g8663.t1